ncbi:DUF350 domain-containing protein [Brevundimonas sp.]|uniref:DUF350 domain-containing protein n=1 Tax=Brevundimonas sp. TaxID=1871086 RepID=UPI004034CA16
MFDLDGFQHGATAFLIAFAAAGAFTIAFKLIYQWITPYHEHTLIRAGNTAAAVTLAEFAAWALLAGGIQILVFLVVSRLLLRDLKTRIEAGEMAPALYLGAISICAGLLNAACMTA